MDQPDDKLLFHTKGYSMWPFLLPGRKLVVRKGVPAKGYRKGDLVCYRDSKGENVCHRLVAQKGGLFYLRGDNAFGRPERVTAEMLVGRVVAIAGGKKLIDLTIWQRCALNRVILYIAPLVSRLNFIMKPLYKPYAKHRE